MPPPQSPIRIAAALVVAMASVALASHARDEPPRAPPPPAPERPATRALREGERLPLDRASAADLELLPGVGPTTAARIIESRATDGPFRTVDELARVKGIGPRTVERLRPFLAVGSGSVRVEDQRDAQAGRERQEVGGYDVAERQDLGPDLRADEPAPRGEIVERE